MGELQMVSEPDPDRCVSEDVELSKGEWVLHPTSVGKGNEILLIGGMDNLPMWRPFRLAGVKTNRAGDASGGYTKADNIHSGVLGHYRIHLNPLLIIISREGFVLCFLLIHVFTFLYVDYIW